MAAAANRHYVLNDKNQILIADENGVPHSDTPVDGNATVHLPTPPPQQADQANVFFANAGKNNAFNASGAAFFSEKQPTYETYEAYLKAQSSAQAAQNHAQQQQQKQQQHAQQHAHQVRQHHAPAPQQQHHHHAPAPQPQVQAAPPPSKGGCTACKDCPNKVLPATITFVNHVPETPIYPESQLKEAGDSHLIKHYYYSQPPPIHTSAAPTPASQHQTPQPTTPHHHQHQQQQPQHHHQPQQHIQQHHHQAPAQVVTKVVKTKQIATNAPPPPPATAAPPAQHAQPQQVYYYPIPHPPAQKHHAVPQPPAQAAHHAPAAKPCTACKQQPAPAPQPKQAAPVIYAHQKPAAYYSTLPSSVSKQLANPLAHYIPAPIVAPAHIQNQHPPIHHSSKQQIVRQKSSGNLLRHQPLAYVAPVADKQSHHHYQQSPAPQHHQKQAAGPSPAPKSNCTSCKQSSNSHNHGSGSLNRAETVGCLPCMQKVTLKR